MPASEGITKTNLNDGLLDRSSLVRPRGHRANLVSVGGDFQSTTSSREAYQAHHRTSRTQIKKHADNLTTEGTMIFGSSHKTEFTEKTVTPEKPEPRVNLRPEGHFERPRHQKYEPGGAHIVIYPDNLKLQADFDKPQLPNYRSVERYKETARQPQTRGHF